ncbi:hypothetical protein RHMOL_Rhmol11G0040600 [Rhododendron molle]|uniref:Uncharacterized protein n=1 Tax=Rhododendron molle TaxID=49168 RepID=A0ACC0LN86_RHOML|nr:hypothetical protein RHMOL_Rhmol11G0040600 [Rhododendron molle]
MNLEPCFQEIEGRDGLTHNMLNDIHNHWKHAEAVRIKCMGVPTVDMKNVCTQLEAVRVVVCDRSSRGRGGPKEVESVVGQVTRTVEGRDAVAASGGESGGYQQPEAGDVVVRLTLERKESRLAGSVVQPLDLNTTMEGLVVIGGGFGNASGNGASGGDTGPSESLPRDSARGMAS